MTPVLPTVFCLGANYQTASAELREKLYLTENQLSTVLPKLKEKYGLAEVAAISTCNRFELFGTTSGEPSAIKENLIAAFLDTHSFSGSSDVENVRKATYIHTGLDAVKHVCRVASSLDSQVIGETQITGQFKDAVALATKINTIGSTIHRLSQEALSTAKKVRTNTDIGKTHVSISQAAIELAKRVFEDLSEYSFLVIGAGEMSRIAAQHILAQKPRALQVANRTLKNAETLISELGSGSAHGLDELSDLLKSTDVVISSISTPGFVINKKLIQSIKSARKGKPIFLFDIGMPRNIDDTCRDIDDVYLFDIDDLEKVVSKNYEKRRAAAEKASVFVEESADNFGRWMETLTVKPALSNFRVYLDSLFTQEAKKTLGKEIFKTLNPEQMDSINSMLGSIANKISADASQNVKGAPSNVNKEQLADALKNLFPLQPVIKN